MNQYLDQTELYHHGIKDQKWGVRRFQNPDGSLTEEGRLRYGYKIRASVDSAVQKIKTKHQAKVEFKKKEKQRKERAKRLEAARKARAEKKAYEEAKKKAYETGTAEEVLKYRKDLTSEEKRKAVERLRTENELARFASDDARLKAEEASRNSKWNKFKNFTDKVGQAAGSVDNFTKFYNSAAKIYNSFSDEKIPVVGESKSSNSDKFRVSMEMGKELMREIPDLTMPEIEKRVERIETIRNVEKLAAGENAGGKKKDKDKKGDKK